MCLKILTILVVSLAVFVYFVTRPGDEHMLSQPEVEAETFMKSSWGEYKLRTYKWEPTGQPKAMLFLSHGGGEHMGRYEKLKNVLVESGILVYGHDHVGHGRSEGYRFHVETYDTYVTDGGLIAVHVLVRVPELFQGAVLSAAMLEIDPAAANPILQDIAKILGNVLPHLPLKAIDPAHISSVPEEVEQYTTDPLNYHGLLKAKWSAESLDAITTARQAVGGIELPILVIHGTQDRLIPPSSSDFLYNKIGSSDKTIELFEDSHHETFHDWEQERARVLVKEWLISHAQL